MGTVNVIGSGSGRKIGMLTGSGRVTDTGTVIVTEGTVTEETATEVNVGPVREIAEVAIGIVGAVIGIMTVTENGNETGRESTLDGPVHVKESERGILIPSLHVIGFSLVSTRVLSVFSASWF